MLIGHFHAKNEYILVYILGMHTGSSEILSLWYKPKQPDEKNVLSTLVSHAPILQKIILSYLILFKDNILNFMLSCN